MVTFTNQPDRKYVPGQRRALLSRYYVDLKVMPAEELDVTAEVQVRWLELLAKYVARAGRLDVVRSRIVVEGQAAAIALAAGVPELFLTALVRTGQVQLTTGGVCLPIQQLPIQPQASVFETNQARRANKLRQQVLSEAPNPN